MRAMICRELGNYEEVLRVGDLPEPPLGAGEVRIGVRAAGVNFADTLITAGKYQHKPATPFVPGFEVSGEVLEVGDGVTTCRPGDRVLAMLDDGGWAEVAVAPQTHVLRIPDALSFVEAAGLPITYGTSHFGLACLANLQPGETLLVHGAAGGVGLTAVEIGKRLGATVIASAGGPEKLEVAREAGADHLIDYRSEDVRDRCRALSSGLGVDVVYDPIGGKTWEASLRCVRAGARMLIIGFAGGEVQRIPANILLVKNVTAIGFAWPGWRDIDIWRVRDSLHQCLTWAESGMLYPRIDRTFPLDRGVDALRALKDRTVKGKIVLVI